MISFVLFFLKKKSLEQHYENDKVIKNRKTESYNNSAKYL